MRLINTSTYKFEEFFDRPVPPYAILSHRWEEQEASYQSYGGTKGTEGHGIEKILKFCEFAKTRPPPYGHVWVDTCCINKHNSTELMESINSMYRWYQNAQTCFVYLRDLPSKEEAHKKDRRKAFCESAWFHRGWTLQELLAPSSVIFCDRNWEVYDSKAQLACQIESITSIAQPFLDGTYQPRQASVAMRMSWASNRQTTKPEDMAYCLLGIFNVNMTLLYGEHEKAFMRLQEEIIKHSDDESIFAWTADCSQWGMLAPSPKAFRESGRVVNFKLTPEQRMPYEMTNNGLRFHSASSTYAANEVHAATAIPMGYHYHKVELGCFMASTNRMIDEDPSAREQWEECPLIIELKRTGPTWQRIRRNALGSRQNLTRKRRSDGTYVGQGVQRTYFIEQPSL